MEIKFFADDDERSASKIDTNSRGFNSHSKCESSRQVVGQYEMKGPESFTAILNFTVSSNFKWERDENYILLAAFRVADFELVCADQIRPVIIIVLGVS